MKIREAIKNDSNFQHVKVTQLRYAFLFSPILPAYHNTFAVVAVVVIIIIICWCLCCCSASFQVVFGA